MFVFTRAARDLVIRPIMPTDLGLESEAYLNTWFAFSNLSLVFCLDFMAFWRLPSQPNVVFDLFYSLHPSWRRLGSSLVIHTWCFVVVNISLFNVIFIWNCVFTICAFSSGRSFQVSPCTSADTEGIQSVVSQLNGADIIMQWVHPPKNVAKILQVYTEVSIKAWQQHFTAVHRTSNHRRLSTRASFRAWVAP